MVDETPNESEGKSNMLIVASTDHFPLFEKASEEWMSLLAAMNLEITKLTDNGSNHSTISQDHNLGDETLAHLVTKLIQQLPSKIYTIPLPSFKRMLLQFEDLIYLDVICNWFKQFGIKCWKGWKHISLPAPDNLTAEYIVDEKPERFIPSDNNDDVLKPPNKPIQMQSPPPSPYLGWIQREEDPPDMTSVIDPKSLKSVLFDDNGDPVFNDNDVMDELNLGEGEEIEIDRDIFGTTMRVPNIIVDSTEAESLRQIAKELHLKGEYN